MRYLTAVLIMVCMTGFAFAQDSTDTPVENVEQIRTYSEKEFKAIESRTNTVEQAFIGVYLEAANQTLPKAFMDLYLKLNEAVEQNKRFNEYFNASQGLTKKLGDIKSMKQLNEILKEYGITKQE